ncbi:ATP-binding cassette domain-containing protein [Trinickia caryophylli]|nr:ATP-binding cassette domain-containing protein [Trinickia caryophylli]PMS13086.1 ABC transporter ATP-binding protein [Trinickia caryophylli]WQE15757.1 ATP-binding cassette domain-containing protein [Trinickia caryophylli]
MRTRLRRRIAADLWEAVWRYRRETLGAAALMVTAKLAGVSVPLVLRSIIDDLGHPAPLALFPVFLVLAYALLRFLGDALGEARDVVFSTVTQHTVASLAERTFARLHRLGARFHAKRETGAIVRDVQKGTDGVGYLLGVGLFTILPALIEIGTVIAIIATNFTVGFSWIIFATLICYATYTTIFTRRRMVVQREVNRLESAADSRLVDSMLNYDTVKYFAAEELESDRYRGVLSHWVVARLRNQRALTALHLGQSAVVCLGIAATMLLAVQYVTAGRMSLGDLVLVNAYIVQVCMPLNTLGFVFRETNDALVNVERMFTVLAGESFEEGAEAATDEDRDEPGAPPLAVTAGEIAFEHVEFGYDPARQILHDVSFRAAPGRTLAVVGGSGSGKSTLVRLLFRLYAPSAGRVTIDGQDLRNVTRRSLREAIGIVPQDTVLFNETIAYNIGYGRTQATRADIVRAARAAQLDEFIERLPDHYDTRVGERGLRLSGGERQRIAIARAFLKDPPIIVFDEATSALDTRSERAIQNEFRRLSEGRTSIVIAHRLSTIVDADRILVMEHGRIVEQGRHDELLARLNGVYARMWALQREQGELEHAQRRFAAHPRQIGELAAAIAGRVATEAAARAVTFDVEIADPLLPVTGETEEIERVVAMLCANEIAHAAAGERVALRAQRAENAAWLVAFGARPKPAPLTDEQAADAEQVLGAAGGTFMPASLDGRVAYVAALPLVPVVPVASPARVTETDGAAQTVAGSAPRLDGIAVLAIDDDEEARDALEAALVANGARVALAASGEDAIRRLADTAPTQWPEVVVCDVSLCDEDGCDVLSRIREVARQRTAPPPPAIALTGHADAATRRRTEEAGFGAHLVKPVRIDALAGEIRRLAAHA